MGVPKDRFLLDVVLGKGDLIVWAIDLFQYIFSSVLLKSLKCKITYQLLKWNIVTLYWVVMAGYVDKNKGLKDQVSETTLKNSSSPWSLGQEQGLSPWLFM